MSEARFDRPRRLDTFEVVFQVAMLTLRRSLRGFRLLWPVLLVLLPGVLAISIARGQPPERQEGFFYLILAFYHFGIAVPVVALILSTSFPWPESDEGTLTYWFTAPASRWAIYIGRTMASLAVGTLLLPISVLAIGLPLEIEIAGPMQSAVTATLLAFPAYVGLFSLSSVCIRKTLVVGVVFVLIENSMSFFAGTIAKLTLVYYVRSLMWPESSPIGRDMLQKAARIDDPASAAVAIGVFVGVAILTILVALPLIQTIEYRGKHAQPG